MLPNIRKPSGITKTVQLSFGGYDRRPDARDGTFRETVGMSQRAFPVMASGEMPVRLVQGTTGTACAVGPVLLRYSGGTVYANAVPIGHAPALGRFIPFGNGAVLTRSKILADLTVLPLGTKRGQSELPANASNGDAWILPPASLDANDQPELWVRENGAWVNKGPMLRDLEAEVTVDCAVFCCGTFLGETATNNCIRQIDNLSETAPEYTMPDLTEHFKPGDAVTIHSGIKEFDQTLIVREVSENELRFYEYSFENLVGRYTVPPGSDNLGPGLYLVKGWDRFERDLEDRPLQYVIIKAGTTLTPGMYLEYRFQDSQFNPLIVQHNTAEILLFQADGTDITEDSTTHEPRVTIAAEYDAEDYPDGPKELLFVEADTGEDLFFGRLDVKITKKWPEKLRAAFADGNRLWGWDGRTLRASKLGDPSNWNCFDGLADDSWAVDLQGPEEITGGISANGFPTFYTESRRIRVYGSTPDAFQLSEQDCNGVLRGCEDSLTIVDGICYYVSGEGVMRDDGTLPVCISQAFGTLRLRYACAGGCGYMLMVSGVSASDNGTQTEHLFSYDARNGTWIEMEQLHTSFITGANGRFYMEDGLGQLLCFGSAPAWGVWENVPSGTFDFRLETNDFVLDEPNTKRAHRVQLRMRLEQNARVEVAIQYDEDGTWNTAAICKGDGARRSVYLPILPRRCDRFRLRFQGLGRWRLESIALEVRTGSPERRPGPRYTE